MKKPKQGQLIWRKDGWSGRYRTVVDGEKVRVCVPLGTDNKSAARQKLDRLVAGTAKPETVQEPETFEEAARRIVGRQGIKTVDERLRRLEKYVFTEFGRVAVTKVDVSKIEDCLQAMADKGLSRETCGHAKDDISTVLDKLWKHGTVTENFALKVELPANAKVDDRPRVVLTDEEFARFVSDPDLDLELRLMALTARCFGGMRTSDLHAWDWSHIDVRAWNDAHVPRPKTKTRDRLGLPELIVPALRAWWRAAGCPVAGPVFPERCRERAGERRGKRSHARRLRAALWAAGVRRGKTRAECELQTDTTETKRVDFHSFRRAFCTALGDADVNVQTAMRLAGHRNPVTHQRYLDKSRTIQMPAKALPDLTRAPSVPRVNSMFSLTTGNNWRPQRELNPCYRRERPESTANAAICGPTRDTELLGRTPYAQAVPSESESFSVAADAALKTYLRELATELGRVWS